MRAVKWMSITFAVYVGFVVVFETGYLGLYQPSFEDSGIPMLLLTTTDDAGETNDRMLARFETDGKIYVSAHHWPRGWYHRARNNPAVQAEIGGVTANYTAVPVSGAEFDRVAAEHPLSLPVRFLMGFPPARDILRLDLNAAGQTMQ
jgi:hypothetical protein